VVDLYEEMVNRRTTLERLAARVPGFAEYLDKKAQRAADCMLRDYIAGELHKRINQFAALEKQLLDAHEMQYLSKTRSVKTKLHLFYEHVKMAASGYSGPFEKQKIRPDELEKLYHFDEAQIRFVDQLDEVLGRLSEAIQNQSNIEEAIAEVNQLAVEANESCSRREAVLTQFSKWA
jgi:hypothetical protein